MFDYSTNKDLHKSIWETKTQLADDFHHFTGLACDNALAEAFMSQTHDNLSIVLISFKNFLKFFEIPDNERTKLILGEKVLKSIQQHKNI